MPDKTSAEEAILAESAGHIDLSTFDQILEMDDDEDHEREFSRNIVYGFFEQAESTFEEIQNSMTPENLAKLSSLGHFLKGSSATLGLLKVKESCEKIQNFGTKKDETGSKDIQDENLCLDLIKNTLKRMKQDYTEAKEYLTKFYEDGGEDSR